MALCAMISASEDGICKIDTDLLLESLTVSLAMLNNRVYYTYINIARLICSPGCYMTFTIRCGVWAGQSRHVDKVPPLMSWTGCKLEMPDCLNVQA